MIWTAVGALGAACFFSRFLLQWLESERAGRSVSPRSFWWLSLSGAALLGATAAAEHEAVLLPGYLVTGGIYVRNLAMQRRPGASSRLGPLPAALLGLAAAAVLLASGVSRPAEALEDHRALLLAGIIGQIIWSLRFLVQWYFTERRGYSHFPLAFWWITLVGALLNLTYTGSLVASDGASKLVFFLSYLPTPLYPIRNLVLERRHRRRSAAAAAGTPAATAPRKPALRDVLVPHRPVGAEAPARLAPASSSARLRVSSEDR